MAAATFTVTHMLPESARSPSPKSRKISGGMGLPWTLKVGRTSATSAVVAASGRDARARQPAPVPARQNRRRSTIRQERLPNAPSNRVRVDENGGDDAGLVAAHAP